MTTILNSLGMNALDYENINPADYTILVDQDGVLADWQEQYNRLLALQHPNIPVIPTEEISVFKAQSLYAPEHQSAISSMMNTPGFYRDLAPIEGAVNALNEMLDMGFNVFLCTAPFISHETCASEKMQWVKEHLGNKWLNRIVITSDKTLVRGDLLIDDKPDITGSMTPIWKHIVFDAPYNRHMETRIDKWADWQNTVFRMLQNA